MTHVILLALIGFAGGAFGGMVGLGGTLFLGVPIHSAVSASLIAVVATSTTAAAAYVREDVTNMRLGMTLETMTVVGALAGGIVGATMGKAVLSGIFGGVMVLVSVYMAVRRRDDTATEAEVLEPGLLGATYYDRSLKREVTYRPRRLWSGMLASLVAGGVSGLLGVGGGFLKVPVMVMSMRVPPRAAVSTSSFMIGVTACVGSIVYLMEGLVDPVVVVPVVLGVTVGAYLGSKLALRIRSSALVTVLAAVLFILSIQMILAAAGISLR
jgi:uncharacterized membrane protein YfcA